jgi:hypothetical protein
MRIRLDRRGGRKALCSLALWVGVATLSCCAAKQEAPLIHIADPMADSGLPASDPTADQELPAANPPADPARPAPSLMLYPPSPAAAPPPGQAWCPCPPDRGPVPVPQASTPPQVPTPVPPSELEQAWCLCPFFPEPTPTLLSKDVPERACTKDAQCGDGMCDRGRCAPLWTEDQAYGQRCNASSAGRLCDGGYMCVDGRCRSCVSADECATEMPESTCNFYRSPASRRRRCTRQIPSVIGSATLPPQPRQNVPNRACSKDSECGDGFCDRDRCAPTGGWRTQTYGTKCDMNRKGPPEPYNGLVCLEGRWRSCVSDTECVKHGADKCHRFEGQEPTGLCRRNIPGPPFTSVPLEPGPKPSKP